MVPWYHSTIGTYSRTIGTMVLWHMSAYSSITESRVEIRAADIAVELEPYLVPMVVHCDVFYADNAHQFPRCTCVLGGMCMRTRVPW